MSAHEPGSTTGRGVADDAAPPLRPLQVDSLAAAFSELHVLLAEERIALFDVAFAEMICRHGVALREPAGSDGVQAPGTEPSPLLAFAAALVSARSARQDVFVELATLAADDPLELDEPSRYPAADALLPVLRSSTAVQQVPDVRVDVQVVRPLVLVGTRLYLARQFEHERALGRALHARAEAPWRTFDAPASAHAPSAHIYVGGPAAAGGAPGPAQLRPALEALFPASDGEPVNWQRIAAAMMLGRGLTVITGGPGTGKTTTVTRALVLLAQWQPEARIALAAPTGKAAARLGEAVQQAKRGLLAQIERGESLVDPRVLDRIPEQGSTLHRLLGYRPLENRFRHGVDDTLPVDVLVIDEASMLDLRLARAAVDALAPDARLVVVGDKDQLSSVDAGRVLGDICAGLETHFDVARFSPGTAALLTELGGQDVGMLAADGVPALADCLAWLRTSHRFRAGGGIAQLARAINDGDMAALADSLAASPAGDAAPAPAGSQSSADIAWTVPDTQVLVQQAVQRYRPMLAAAQAGDADAALRALGAFRVLCAVREGRDGVLALNRAIAEALVTRGRGATGQREPGRRGDGRAGAKAPLYAGLPLIVLRNDARNGLYNGDVGVVVHDDDGLVVAFGDGADGVRLLAPARLPTWEPVYAMTIHKSQGSEFDEVAVVLPRAPSANEARLLTRELVYTAVTRARARVRLAATREVLANALATRTRRASGLRDLLWGADGGTLQGG